MLKLNKRRRILLNQRRNQCILFVLLFLQLQEVQRRWWVHPINLLRKEKGEFYQMYPDLRHYNRRFTGMYRMSVEKFEELLKLVKPKITKKWTYMQEPISAEQKLILTLT